MKHYSKAYGLYMALAGLAAILLAGLLYLNLLLRSFEVVSDGMRTGGQHLNTLFQ